MEYMDETTGEATFVSRFGTSDEPEQPWFDQTCGRTVSIKKLILTKLLDNLILYEVDAPEFTKLITGTWIPL